MDATTCSPGQPGQCPSGALTGSDLGLEISANQSCVWQWLLDGDLYTCRDVTPVSHNPDRKTPLISNETKRVLELAINVIILTLTSILGILGNVVNIRVYWRHGLTDSITLGFFALSVSDLILVLMPFLTGTMYAAKYALPDSPVDFSSVHYASFGWARNFMYSSSCLITAFLALERCCCIVFPFKVQSVFTRARTGVFLALNLLFHATCMAILPAAVQLRWQAPSSNPNGSRILRVWFSEYREDIELFYSTVMSLIVPVGTQVVVTVCAFVMVHGLRQAAKFRARATGKGNGNVGPEKLYSSPETPADDGEESSNKDRTDSKRQTTQLSSMSQRDARLVKTMVFLVSILSACNIPFLAATFAWKSIPDLNIGRPYQNTLSVVFSVVYVLGNLNASANILVYYHTSTRFRTTAKEIFSGDGKKKLQNAQAF